MFVVAILFDGALFVAGLQPRNSFFLQDRLPDRPEKPEPKPKRKPALRKKPSAASVKEGL